MSVYLIEEKVVTTYISLSIMEILNNPELSKQFCGIINNRYLYSHSLDTARYAVQIALVLDKNMNMIEVAKAGLLHDIGKIDIPIEIINKPGKLTKYEFSIMEGHSKKGYDRLSKLGVGLQVQDVVLHHHEKLTGDGYPDGITHISLMTQMITIADIFSALTELRSYKKPMSAENAFKILRDKRGLNQSLVDILESKVIDEVLCYNAMKFARYYRNNIKALGFLYKKGSEVYILGDELVKG